MGENRLTQFDADQEPDSQVAPANGAETRRRGAVWLGVAIGTAATLTVTTLVDWVQSETPWGCKRAETAMYEDLNDASAEIADSAQQVSQRSSACEETGRPDPMLTIHTPGWETRRDARRAIEDASWLPNDSLYLSPDGQVEAWVILDKHLDPPGAYVQLTLTDPEGS